MYNDGFTDEQWARMDALFLQKLAAARAGVATRDFASVSQTDVQGACPELPEAATVILAEQVLAKNFHEIDRLSTAQHDFGMVWYTDDVGLRRRSDS